MKKTLRYVLPPIIIYLMIAYVEGTFYLDENTRLAHILICVGVGALQWFYNTMISDEI